MASGTREGNGQGSRLDSWKAIAEYLGLDVRSVQRWETGRGLPVHRVPGEKRGRVFGFTGELDEWLRSGGVGNPVPGELPEPPKNGIEPPASAGASGQRTGAWLVRSGVLALVGIVVVLAASYGALRWSRGRVHAHPQRTMLAVLPFLNLSGDPAQDYIADGLTEEMITDLGRLNPQALGVIARTSAMKYKNTHEDAAEIGRELGVQYILEGSVRREGNAARISAQLIQVSDQTHVWAQNYERQMEDILSVEEDVAQSITEKIQIQLSPGHPMRPVPAQATNGKAYDNYLRGLYGWNRRADPGLSESVQYFNAAIVADPNFAPAYAGLAKSETLLAQSSVGPAREKAAAMARAAALKAIELDDSSAEAHTALGGIKIFFDFDLQGAKEEFQRAIELDPNYAPARHWYANLYLDPAGHYDEAIAEMRAAVQLDPVNLILNADYGQAYFFARQYGKALEIYQRILAMDPDFQPAHWYRADCYQQLGMHKEEVEEVAEVVRVWQLEMMHDPNRAAAWPAALRVAFQDSGYDGFLKERLRQLAEIERNKGAATQLNVMYHAALGEKTRALDDLDRLYAERNINIIYLKAHPAYDSLRSEPRFQAMEQKLGLSEK